MKKILILLVSLIAACDGDVGTPSQKGTTTISGVAALGTITAGTVAAYNFSSCLKGDKLAEFKLDSNNFFELPIKIAALEIPILLELSDITYEESVGGNEVNARQSFLYSSFVLQTGRSQNASISYWTNLAHARTSALCIESPALGVDHVLSSNDMFSKALLFDIITVLPEQIGSEQIVFLDNEAIRYGIANIAVSYFTYNMDIRAYEADSSDGGLGHHDVYNSIVFSEMAFDDLSFDKILDGKGTAGELVMGAVAIQANTYRRAVPNNMYYALAIADLKPYSQIDQIEISADTFNQSTLLDIYPPDVENSSIGTVSGPKITGATFTACNTCFTNQGPDRLIRCDMTLEVNINEPKRARYTVSGEYVDGSGTVSTVIVDPADGKMPQIRLGFEPVYTTTTTQTAGAAKRTLSFTAENEFGISNNFTVEVDGRVFKPGQGYWYDNTCSVKLVN